MFCRLDLIIVVRRVLIHTYQLQDVFFRADIVERVVVHGLGKIDRVEDLDRIAVPYKHLSTPNDDGALCQGFPG